LDPKVAVLLVRSKKERNGEGEDNDNDDGEGEIIAYAKWVLVEEGYEEVPWHWPEEMDFELLRKWTEMVVCLFVT